FSSRGWQDANTDWDYNGEPIDNIRLSNDGERPDSGVPHLIEDSRPDGGLVIRFERDGEVYDRRAWEPIPDKPGWGYRGGYRKPKRRASATIYRTDEFILPYDLVSVADLERFLGSRRNRREYITLWPLLRSTLLAKREEEKAEA